MGKTVPTTLTLPGRSEAQLGRVVEAADWVNLNQALNHRFAREGCRLHLHLFWDDHNPFQTTSTTWTTVNAGTGDLDLDDCGGLFRFRRKIYAADTVAGEGYEVTLKAYAENLDVRLLMTRADSTTSAPSGADTSVNVAYNVDASGTSDAEWISANLEFTPGQASIAGSSANDLAFFYCFLQVKVPSAGTGFLWQAMAEESRVGSNELPRG